MNTPQDSLLGHEVAYPTRYDPSLLFAIARSPGRQSIGLVPGAALPFVGYDRWQAYELGWLDPRGKPQVAVASFIVPCESPHLIESKSLKLYLNSLNAMPFNSEEALRERIALDLSARAGADVQVSLSLSGSVEAEPGEVLLDLQDIDIDHYGPPRPDFLRTEAGHPVEESLTSQLLKSNCPVTGQPDWADLRIRYRGARIDPAGLLRYLVSFRDHAEFHEQCVERIFLDLLQRCQPQMLSVEARYTRRGGLDINPWRASPGVPPPVPSRGPRQ